MSKLPASFLQCRDAEQRCKKMEALSKIRNHHKSEIRKVAVMLRILTDQERSQHRRLLRQELKPIEAKCKEKNKPKVDGNGKGEHKGAKGGAKWKGNKKDLHLVRNGKGKTKNSKSRRSSMTPSTTSDVQSVGPDIVANACGAFLEDLLCKEDVRMIYLCAKRPKRLLRSAQYG